MAKNSSTPQDAPNERELALARSSAELGLEARRMAAPRGEWVRQLSPEQRLFFEQLAKPAVIALGDAYGSASLENGAEAVLRWAITWLRPDRVPSLDIPDRAAWLERASWRPVVALLCHYGYVTIPEFTDLYYRKRGESPADTLCGLWGIGPSTFYRCLETAKRRLAQALAEQAHDACHTAAIQAAACREAYRALGLDTPEAQRAWHAQQAGRFAMAESYLAALWHWRMAHDFEAVHQVICLHLADLAGEAGIEDELEAWRNDPDAGQRQRVYLNLDLAALHRIRNEPERELEAIERALRIAASPEDPLSLGLVYSRLGKFYESRDAERAFACYQDSLDCLSRSDEFPPTPEAHQAHIETLVKLAWLYTLRNDPRAQALLNQAETMTPPASGDSAALLQQAWGEYWRRLGDFDKALEHKYRALNLYERLGDAEGVLKTYINLGVIYDDLKRYGQAMNCYQRVLDLAKTTPVDPEHIASVHLNLGACRFWLKDYDAAIDAYRRALDTSTAAGLQLHIGRAHYNLAETFYTRYLDSHDDEDERQGDAHVAAAVAAWGPDNFPVYVDSARGLKTSLLGGTKQHAEDRFLPQEKAAHYAEMAEIEKYRSILDGQADPEKQVQARLAIAQAYLAISAKERDAALRLCDKYGLTARFEPQLRALRQEFEQSLPDQERIARRWREVVRLDEPLLRHAARRLLQDNQITKRVYAEACQVSLATASKHLVSLAQAGCLVQVGKGAGTRYVLP